MSFLKQLGVPIKAWREANVTPANQITPSTGYEYGLGSTTVSTLLGTGRRQARQRQVIYEKWATMQADPICSSALKINCTAALGGDPQTGQMVYLEKSSLAQTDKKLGKIAEEITADLSDIFNEIAYEMAFNGAAYGDAYVRIYTTPKRGVVDLLTDELYLPPMVQAYEMGGRTVGFEIYAGQRFTEKLDITQLARLKMPRTQWIPQPSIVMKSMKSAINADYENQVIMPSMVGGSLLYAAEPAWENLVTALSGIVGQRISDSLDEAYLTLNMESMTAEQQKRSVNAVVEMLKKTKKVIDDAVANGTPILERIRHILPVNGEKQITNITPMGSSRSATITVEDVMLYARMTAGALGVDLSLIGFLDQVSAVFSDGGMSHVSAQVAETSRIIRRAESNLFNQIIDVHTSVKYGVVFPADARPVTVNFYGSIAAFEAEQSKTKADNMNSGMLLIQAMQTAKDLGWDKEMMQMFLTRQMMLEEEEAALYAKMVDMKPPADSEGAAGSFGGEE